MFQIREIRVIDLITYFLLPPALGVLLWTTGTNHAITYFPDFIPEWSIYTAAVIISYFLLKRFAIGAVLMYKAFAPMSVRGRCLFTPTCSTYMIMAIGKYGLFIGVIKGIGRILRCHPPNGGEDYP